MALLMKEIFLKCWITVEAPYGKAELWDPCRRSTQGHQTQRDLTIQIISFVLSSITGLRPHLCANGQDAKGVEEVPTIENVKINLEGLLAFTTHFIIINLKSVGDMKKHTTRKKPPEAQKEGLWEEQEAARPNATLVPMRDAIKTRVESSTLPDAGREIQIRTSDALVVSPQFHAHVHFDQIEEQKNNPTMKYRLKTRVYSYRGDYQFKHCYLRARVMPYAKEREAAGNQETFKPQEHGLANVMLGGIIRLPCEEYIFVQALSLELAMALPINREIQSSLHCDAFVGTLEKKCGKWTHLTRTASLRLERYLDIKSMMEEELTRKRCGDPWYAELMVVKTPRAVWAPLAWQPSSYPYRGSYASFHLTHYPTRTEIQGAAVGRDWREHRIDRRVGGQVECKECRVAVVGDGSSKAMNDTLNPLYPWVRQKSHQLRHNLKAVKGMDEKRHY
ncbi:hypothetical protein EV421DRAFT_1738113 [Armillaria borealis]|uniref:Uncharacterized protein n=1 Tax=Armillaria borealis TaxID=47425 RepID=A0AA39JA00_9AGAR|nr:hypothetical protein EV421DRAFT_1738113 [Armillaria borealis]